MHAPARCHRWNYASRRGSVNVIIANWQRLIDFVRTIDSFRTMTVTLTTQATRIGVDAACHRSERKYDKKQKSAVCWRATQDHQSRQCNERKRVQFTEVFLTTRGGQLLSLQRKYRCHRQVSVTNDDEFHAYAAQCLQSKLANDRPWLAVSHIGSYTVVTYAPERAF